MHNNNTFFYFYLTGEYYKTIDCSSGLPNGLENLCLSCPVGMYVNGLFCQHCPDGTVVGKDFKSCQPCPSLKVPNADKTECKLCPVGTIFKSGVCKTCPKGGFRTNGKNYCTSNVVQFLSDGNVDLEEINAMGKQIDEDFNAELKESNAWYNDFTSKINAISKQIDDLRKLSNQM